MSRRSIAERPWSIVRGPWHRTQRTTDNEQRTSHGGFTLIEMLIAMAITLIMIGAVVTLFANISNGVRNRRAVVEVSGQLRHARNVLQSDLQGATCPGLTWQRPEDNVGYIEIIEGLRREGYASALIDTAPDNGEIDHRTSILPASNAPFKDSSPNWETDGAGLGDYDDILMLTVRNEHEPFVGRVPSNVRPNENNAAPFDVNSNTTAWSSATIESPLAEVVWYAVENPSDEPVAAGQPSQDPDNFFGEPGLRTIYRRTLLIAPFLNPYRLTLADGTYDDTFSIGSDDFQAKPGLLRILGDNVDQGDVAQAIAALIAFQERYDISARVEWDPLLGQNDGRWKIVANTLADLTKRENRYEHHFMSPLPDERRLYPYAVISTGSGYGGVNVTVVLDREVVNSTPSPTPAETFTAARANLIDVGPVDDVVRDYTIEDDNLTQPDHRCPVRPFAFISSESDTVATARAMLNDEGEVVRVILGPVPLSRERRGEDVMLTDALGFDLRVFDPGAPLFGRRTSTGSSSPLSVVLEPSDPAWWRAYESDDNMDCVGSATSSGLIGNVDGLYPFVGQGAYVDMGYGFIRTRHDTSANLWMLPNPDFANPDTTITPWFFTPQPLKDVYNVHLAPGYVAYDTWSFHYENNGVNEDGDLTTTGDPLVDEGTNGLDDLGVYHDPNPAPPPLTIMQEEIRLGPDDVGERETRPPYDKPLRGVQGILRLYERDSRQIRQVTVNQNFVPE
jgi:prepilin-type N-terminal cleavage/methylation domain-containing protein